MTTIAENSSIKSFNTRLEGEITVKELVQQLNEWFGRKVDQDSPFTEADIYQYLIYGCLPQNLGGNSLVKRRTEKKIIMLTVGEPVWEPFIPKLSTKF